MSAFAVVAALVHMDHSTDEVDQLMWTATEDSLVRITMFTENAAHIGGATLHVNYTDTFGEAKAYSATSTNLGDTVVFKVKGGSDIKVSTTGIAASGSPVNGYFVVEQLQVAETRRGAAETPRQVAAKH